MDYSTLRQDFKKVRFQALHFQDPVSQNDAVHVRFHKRAFHVDSLSEQGVKQFDGHRQE